MVVLLLIVFAITALISLSPIKNRKVANLVFWGIGCCLFLLSALRLEEQSPDYIVYLGMYESYETVIVEPTFSVLSWFVKSVFDNSLFLFVIYAALGVFIKLKAIKELSPLWILGILTYMSTIYIIQEHAQMRAGVATAFFMLCIKPLYERNGRRFLFYALCATLFHFSALIIFPLWFIAKLQKNRLLLWVLIPLGYLIYLLGINVISTALPFEYIQSKLTLYQALQEAGRDGFDQINVFGLGILMKCFFYYILLFFADTIRPNNRYVDLLLILYAVGIFFIPAFATMPVISYRLSAILVSVEILLFPMFYYIFTPKIVSRIIVILIASINLYLSFDVILSL